MTGMAIERAALVANPGSREGVAAADSAAALLRGAGVEAEVLVSERPGHCRELAAAAAREGFDLVASVGGDGTLGEVANGLMDVDGAPPLAIIPAGTGNDTAKALRIPHDLAGALDLIFTGQPLPLDVSEVNGTRFVGLGAMGFAARVGEAANWWKSGYRRPWGRAFGQRIYHIASAHYMLFGPRSLRGGVHCDAYDLDGIIFTIIITPNPGLDGVFVPCPAARAGDGKLDVLVVRARTPRGRKLTMAQKVRTAYGTVHGTHLKEPWVDCFQTAGEIRIELSEESFFMGDGDTLCRGKRFLVRPLPGALRVMLRPQGQQDDRAPASDTAPPGVTTAACSGPVGRGT